MTLRLLPAVLPVLVCACAGTPTTPTLTAASGTVVEVVSSSNYQLVTAPWSKGAQVVTGTVSDGSAAVTTGTIAASGALNVPLPATLPDSALTGITPSVQSGCTGGFQASDPAAQGARLSLRATAGSETRLVSPETISGTSTDASNYAYVYRMGMLFYADRPVTISGTSSCVTTGGTTTNTNKTTYQVTLVKGWNKLTASYAITRTPDSFTNEATWTSGSLPSTNWLFGSLD